MPCMQSSHACNPDAHAARSPPLTPPPPGHQVWPIVTYGIYYIQVSVYAAYLYLESTQGPAAADELISAMTNDHLAVQSSGEVYRFLTSTFVHENPFQVGGLASTPCPACTEFVHAHSDSPPTPHAHSSSSTWAAWPPSPRKWKPCSATAHSSRSIFPPSYLRPLWMPCLRSSPSPKADTPRWRAWWARCWRTKRGTGTLTFRGRTPGGSWSGMTW
jgi:hypothetical protein